jgi:serine/threonine protein phosphatase PrpC
MDLLPGDVIVLVSDGVTEGREECPELFEYLRSRLLTHDSDDLADAIMKYAEEQGCEDDVSAVVIRITERPLSDFLCDE